MGNDAGAKLTMSQGKPGRTDEQGDQLSRQDRGICPVEPTTQLLEGEKPPRGPRLSSNPSSKGGLETFLSPKKVTHA